MFRFTDIFRRNSFEFLRCIHIKAAIKWMMSIIRPCFDSNTIKFMLSKSLGLEINSFGPVLFSSALEWKQWHKFCRQTQIQMKCHKLWHQCRNIVCGQIFHKKKSDSRFLLAIVISHWKICPGIFDFDFELLVLFVPSENLTLTNCKAFSFYICAYSPPT